MLAGRTAATRPEPARAAPKPTVLCAAPARSWRFDGDDHSAGRVEVLPDASMCRKWPRDLARPGSSWGTAFRGGRRPPAACAIPGCRPGTS